MFATPELKRTPVRVLNEANRVRVIMASDALFYPGTAVFSSNAPVILAEAEKTVMQTYHAYQKNITMIDVAASTDDLGTDLMSAQANHVAAHFWSKGIPDQLLCVKTKLSDVSSNRTMSGKADNRRVEIRVHIKG
jgi:outer membrane protein OmpA-like peptidoglycan-associated protein